MLAVLPPVCVWVASRRGRPRLPPRCPCWRGRPLVGVGPRPPLRCWWLSFPARWCCGVGVCFSCGVFLAGFFCFLAGFQCVVWCSFSGLGRLFLGLGRLFWGLGCALGSVFFRSFVVFFGSVLWLPPLFLRLPRWCRRLGFLPSLAGLLFASSASPPRALFPFRGAWLPRVLASLLGSVAALGARGGLRGLWLAFALRAWVCRCCLVVLPLLASSFRSFLNFF